MDQLTGSGNPVHLSNLNPYLRLGHEDSPNLLYVVVTLTQEHIRMGV